MDFALLNYLKTIPPDTVLYAVVLAVIIAPWVYRWRSRVRRIMIRMSWIALGVFLGWNLSSTAAASQLEKLRGASLYQESPDQGVTAS